MGGWQGKRAGQSRAAWTLPEAGRRQGGGRLHTGQQGEGGGSETEIGQQRIHLILTLP